MPDFYFNPYGSDELYHYGVKGMKWGVRRYQNADGSLTPQGKKRYSYKDIIDNNTDTDRKLKDLYKEYDNELKKIPQPKSPYLDKSGHISKEWSDYNNKVNKVHNKYDKKTDNLYDKLLDERKENIKNIFSDEKIKNDVNTLRDINNQIENLRENYLGASSKAYQQARKEYFNNHKDMDKDEADYGFSHYSWAQGNPAYDKAYSDYKKENKALLSKQETLRVDIGRKVTEGYSDKKLDGLEYYRWAEADLIQYFFYDN